ncbi:MAG TPA: cbb3-type cytochrome oxidase assembly protein CcoS [Bacteroidales bacterium]|nr:cbb3-type cytochrome oxidase assembly protein CcoS [Bacteroidales bacterium]
MSAIIFLIILGIIVTAGFVIAFIWAVRNGQYDDDYTPSVRILFDSKKEAVSEDERVTQNHDTSLTNNQ